MTTISTIDARAHVTAVKAAITAQLGQWSAYGYDQVPTGDLPNIFVTVAAERRSSPRARIGSQAELIGWRISATAVGRTVNEALWALSRIDDALDEVSLTIDAQTTTPCLFESGTSPKYGDGRYAGDVFYTYVL